MVPILEDFRSLFPKPLFFSERKESRCGGGRGQYSQKADRGLRGQGQLSPRDEGHKGDSPLWG